MVKKYWAYTLGFSEADTQVLGTSILGIVWLKSIGPTLWDFQKQTLRVWKDEKEIIYKGIQLGVVDVVDGETMNVLWQAKGVIYYV